MIKSNDPRPQWVRGVRKEELVAKYSGVFEPAYFELRRLVRVGGLESDLHVLHPGEFHADTTELVQMLSKGHHGVKLDRDAWDRLSTWIDLNAPCHGTWREILGLERTRADQTRRRQLRNLYAGIDDDARSSPPGHGSRVVRGGSWYDRPKRCRSAFRLSYPAWQKVYNVGFRVVCEASELPDLAGNSGR